MMFSLKAALTTLATLATTSQAIYFHLDPFSVSDVRIPSESHTISFTISNPPAVVVEQGGPGKANCTISWTGCDVPSCWTSCQRIDSTASGSYYARVSPDSYAGAYNFTLEVQEYYFYRGTHVFNASIPVLEGEGGYRCSRGGQSDICGYWGEPSGVDSDLDLFFYVSQQSDVC